MGAICMAAILSGRHGKETSTIAAVHSARVVVSRWYPNGSCRRADWTTGPTRVHHAGGGVAWRGSAAVRQLLHQVGCSAGEEQDERGAADQPTGAGDALDARI